MRQAASVAIAVLGAACGRVGFEPSVTVSDAAPAATCATPEFLPALVSPSLSGPANFRLARLDADDTLDLVVVSSVQGELGVMRGDGTGRFGPSERYPQTSGPRDLEVADLDVDGTLDVVFTSDPMGVCMVRGRGDGTFATCSALVTTLQGPHTIAIGRLDADARPDVVVGAQIADRQQVLLTRADGSLGTPATMLADSVNPVSDGLVDLDGDGALDLIAANIISSTLTRFRGLGDGTFATALVTSIDTHASWVAAANLDRSGGNPDVLLATIDAIVVVGAPSFDDGPPTARYPTSVMLPNLSNRALDLGDLNGDGFPDLAATNRDASSIDVRINNGDGTFGPATVLSVGGTARFVRIADVTRDGLADLVVSAGSDRIEVFASRCP